MRLAKYEERNAKCLQRHQDERARIMEVRNLGTVPERCGPNIISAPARGPVQTFTPKAMYPKGTNDYELKPAGNMGHDALRCADVFDRMLYKARLAHKGLPLDYIPPFTPAQIAMGRLYSTVFERHACAGIRCSSVDTIGGNGSGGDGGFIDAVIRDREEIKRMQQRIGKGTAMIVRRQRPSVRGARMNISNRALVDMVCLHDKSLTDVLLAHGWSGGGKNIKVVQQSLCEALDRMMGPHWNGRMQVMRSPDMLVGKQALKKCLDC